MECYLEAKPESGFIWKPYEQKLGSKDMPSEFERIKRLYSDLMKTTVIKFPLARERLEASAELGVYIILDDKDRVVHVGRTPRAKKGIAQRLKGHLYGRSSFTRLYLKGNGTKLRGKYSFKYIAVKNGRERALLEAYAIGRLCPKHLGLGDSAS